jgi:RHS repeat-associated protein
VISYEEYHPYGTSAYRAWKNGVEVSAKRYRYNGKERDEETSLYYYGARYYAPWLGRWTAADSAGLVDGPGLYNFCRGSPVTLRDPNGTDSEEVVLQRRSSGQQNVEYKPPKTAEEAQARKQAAERTPVERAARTLQRAAVKLYEGIAGPDPAPKEAPPIIEEFAKHSGLAVRTEEVTPGKVAEITVAIASAPATAAPGVVFGLVSGASDLAAGGEQIIEGGDAEAQQRGAGRLAAGIFKLWGILSLARGALKSPKAVEPVGTGELPSRGSSGTPAFDPAKLQRIQEALGKTGVTFEQNPARLQAAGASGLYEVPAAGGPGKIVLGPNPSRATVIEELTHLGQHRRAGFPPRAEFVPSIQQQARIEMSAVQKILSPGGHQRRGVSFTAAEVTQWIRNWNFWRVLGGS